ncbi:RNA polymerase III transcription factor IIIC subunit-domain-containing protein [Cubamyces menziesii]|nr:RNA polymerase III transcription factor IIIC subunit-domain-containing protein [Cubamyces menziesii]
MDQPEAGPSQIYADATATTDASATDANSIQNPVTQATPAPERPLPSTHFYSVEYPGYVRPSSAPLAIERLGGPHAIDSAFRRASGRDKVESLLELRLRPGNPYAHPIPGEIVPTSNIVLKVVKRRRRRKDGQEFEGGQQDGAVGEYTVEAVGTVPKTARFRSMADFQYQPDMSDPVAHLRTAMDTMDVDGILKYHIPPETEDYTVTETDPSAMEIDPQLLGEGEVAMSNTSAKTRSNLRLFTPPLFSRQGVPQNYNYKANPASVETIVVDEETGEEKKRLINRMRWKGYGPIAISYADKGVPDKPSAAVEEQRGQADKKILQRLEELFAERPVWTRAAIFNQFTPLEVRDIINSKYLLPLVSYVFEDGPWRDTYVRLGYDPRQDPEARFYQRLYFRNINHPISRPSVVSRRQEQRNESAQARFSGVDDRRSHIFDGVTVTSETAAFQLCDITDPMLKEMIEDEDALRETCSERDGWYTTHALERIKAVLRHKFFSLLLGHIATREECERLLVPDEGTDKLPQRHRHRLKFGKHNMAKGALPPEDAAAHRLMTTLEQQRKTFPSR